MLSDAIASRLVSSASASPTHRITSRSASSLHGRVLPLGFPIPFTPAYPYLRLILVVTHAVYRFHEIRIAYGKKKALHILLPVAMPDDHVGYNGMDAAAHRVGLPAVTQVMYGRSGIEVEALDRGPLSSRQGILTGRIALIVEDACGGEAFVLTVEKARAFARKPCRWNLSSFLWRQYAQCIPESALRWRANHP